jgi:hypothetical protein
MLRPPIVGALGRPCLLGAAIGILASNASLADKIGKVTEPLVAETVVSAQEQKDQALVAITTGIGVCSAALLNSEWVITAKHCFTGSEKAANLSVEARWPTVETKKGREYYFLGPDVAIVRVESPFSLRVDYNMPVYTGDILPGRMLKVYGQGIYQLATGEGDSAVPSKGDKQYRSAEFQVSHVDNVRFWHPPGKNGEIPAGGDSGGPAFINAGGQTYLAGVSSLCMVVPVKGKPNNWTWATKVTECGYVPLAPVWSDILGHIGSPACRNYAWRAVGAVQYAKYVGCDPATISGPRFSPNFDDHLNFCMHAKPADANFEDSERNRITQECRIAAGMPKGTADLMVKAGADGSFTLSGSKYPVNSRIIIRSTDAAGEKKNFANNFSDAQGNWTVTLTNKQVCSAPGQVTFTAEDQDRPPSAPVSATCIAVNTNDNGANPPPNPQGNPEPEPGPPDQQFVEVNLSVDVYARPGGVGKPEGVLEANTKEVVLLEPCNDNWCHVKWPAGQGWVYSGPDYQSLKLP